MKYIKIPIDVLVPITDGKGMMSQAPFQFNTFLREALDMHPPLGKGLKQIRKAVKIHDRIDKIGKKPYLELADDEYVIVAAAVEAASWKAFLARRFLPYYIVIEEAVDELPEEEPKKASDPQPVRQN